MPAALLLAALLYCACREAPAVMLHEAARYQGKVVIHQEREITGELVFDRASKNLQWVVRGPTTVTLARRDDGKIIAFENGQPRDVSAKELADFALVAGVVEIAPRAGDVVRRQRDGYEIVRTEGTLRVRLLETIRGHGSR